MKKWISLLLALILSLSLMAGGATAENAEESAEAAEAPVEDLVVLQHSAVVQGQTLHYTTTTGILPVKTEGGTCEVFFMAYTLDGVDDLSARPVTFAYNGGPGSSSEFVHMGFLAPRRIAFDENGNVQDFPAQITDNEYSILDLTDLVFIDPVGTGYSRPAEGTDRTEFIGYQNDLRSVGDFIRLYTNRYGRWGSPKYLAGESYGTTRSVGLAEYLADTYDLNLNGLMLISCIHDLTVVLEEQPADLAYVLYLPTYTADAWYHHKLSPEYQAMDLEALTEEARAFAGGEYLSALFRGRNLGETEKEQIAERMAALTGLDAARILGSNLRVTYRDFCKWLLEDEQLVIGRIDGRYTGPLTNGDMGSGAADPSSAANDGIYAAAVNRYISEELGYHTDRPYYTSSLEVNALWSFPDGFGRGFVQYDTVYNIMSKNRFLKVWALGGYYDLATPFFSAEWFFDHVFINEETAKNFQFTHYPCGHMIYMQEDCLAQFRREAEAWYAK